MRADEAPSERAPRGKYAGGVLEYSENPGLRVFNVARLAGQNQDFRAALWTGCFGQMTLMCIPVGSDIGLEIHEDTDQMIRIEQGCALVLTGEDRTELDCHIRACAGDVIFVPAGTWHNVLNIGGTALKVSSVYAPPHHPAGTMQHTKADAE